MGFDEANVGDAPRVATANIWIRYWPLLRGHRLRILK